MLIRLRSVDSTQSFLARHPGLGFCGALADAQTAGRGRGSNSWESRQGAGLWLSARLPLTGLPPGAIMQSAALAAAGALAPCGAILGLKWPNDLVAYRQNKDGGQKRLVKIGGIIGEQKEGCVILGLGLNIYSAPEIPGRPFPPASLVSLGASNIPDTLALAQSILAAWQSLETLRPEAPPQAAAFRWPSAGDAIQWEGGSGICQGWEADGRLAVLAESGIVLLASADVSAVGDAMNNG